MYPSHLTPVVLHCSGVSVCVCVCLCALPWPRCARRHHDRVLLGHPSLNMCFLWPCSQQNTCQQREKESPKINLTKKTSSILFCFSYFFSALLSFFPATAQVLRAACKSDPLSTRRRGRATTVMSPRDKSAREDLQSVRLHW